MQIQRLIYVWLAFGASSGVFLSSCASEAQMTAEAQARSNTAAADLTREPVCCASFSDIEYVPLSQKRTSIELQPATAPVRKFDGGLSYFLAVEISDDTRPVTIGVRSDPLNGGRGEIPTVFVPSVIQLTSDLKQVGAPYEVPLTFRRGWTRDDVGYFSDLTIEDSSIRYLIFFTDLVQLKSPVAYHSSAETAGGGALVAIEVNYELPRSPNGHLDVWLE